MAPNLLSALSLSSLLLLAGNTLAVQSSHGKGNSPLVQRSWNGAQYACKVYPDDATWPSVAQWKQLNASVDGNLQIDIPPGAVCHNVFQGPLGNISTYDAAKCASVTANFGNEQWTYVIVLYHIFELCLMRGS
jgi:hypothetical protein